MNETDSFARRRAAREACDRAEETLALALGRAGMSPEELCAHRGGDMTDWAKDEVRRARERIARTPRWARPLWTRESFVGRGIRIRDERAREALGEE